MSGKKLNESKNCSLKWSLMKSVSFIKKPMTRKSSLWCSSKFQLRIRIQILIRNPECLNWRSFTNDLKKCFNQSLQKEECILISNTRKKSKTWTTILKRSVFWMNKAIWKNLNVIWTCCEIQKIFILKDLRLLKICWNREKRLKRGKRFMLSKNMRSSLRSSSLKKLSENDSSENDKRS